MATAKIEFNSPHGIYLHDTPEPHLFATGQRFYSSGCVRVEKVATLIDWILQGQDGLNQSRIAELGHVVAHRDGSEPGGRSQLRHGRLPSRAQPLEDAPSRALQVHGRPGTRIALLCRPANYR